MRSMGRGDSKGPTVLWSGFQGRSARRAEKLRSGRGLFLAVGRLPFRRIAVLQERISFLLTRPVGRPPKRPVVWHYDFTCQAASWDRPRRVVAKIEWHEGELFPRVGGGCTKGSLRRNPNQD